ncbi:MAG: histidine kinase dimerization/phospho-acceptor domain-containing protein [Cyanobacteriota bacterium ELA615]
MNFFESNLFCSLDGLTSIVREQKRLEAIESLGLLKNSSIPILEETTQAVFNHLPVACCGIALIIDQLVHIKADCAQPSFGLSNTFTLESEQSFCTHVVDSHHPLAIEDTLVDDLFSKSILTYKYRIRSYLGVPLIHQRQCIGTLFIVKTTPHSYDENTLKYLYMVARCCLQEIELAQLKILNDSYFNEHLDVIYSLGEELRTPLTAIVGMTSILSMEILGELNFKQKEYLNTIYTSGQNLSILLGNLLDLTFLPQKSKTDTQGLVNIEMLCQKLIKSLFPITSRKLQKINYISYCAELVLVLDSKKVYQALFYLVFSIVETAPCETTIELQLSFSEKSAIITVNCPNAECFWTKKADLSCRLINTQGGKIILDQVNRRYSISLPRTRRSQN